MIDSPLLFLALMIFGGLFLSRFAKKINLPNVSGFLVAGLIMGPYALNIIPLDVMNSMDLLSELALAFIAFSIGSEFKISYFKRVGLTPIVIAILEASMAVILVDAVLILIGVEIPVALLLGAIAAATDAATTIMVIKQYKTKGPVTETLLSVVAIDDAVALILFGISVSLSKAIVSSGSSSLFESLLDPFWEIGFSMGAGFILGFLLTFISKFFESRGNRLSLAFSFVFFAVFIADNYGGSPLLMVMVLSATYANLYKHVNVILELTERATPPIYIIFFVLAGAHLNVAVLPSIGIIGTAYIVVRVIGKYFGAYLAGVLMKATPNIKKYVGPALLPQAGVAIGLTFVAQDIVPEYASVIRAVILCGTLVYELIGPAVSKMTLEKAGEITQA